MLNLKIGSLGEIIADTPGLQARGDWLCLNIETRTAWPTKAQPFFFEGCTVWVMPLTTDHYPGLAADKPAEMDRDECFALLHRALSVLSWLQNTGAIVVHMSGGSVPRMIGREQSIGNAIREEFDLSDLPAIQGPAGKLALALIREGRGLNHPAYSFLSFFRALEAAIPHGPTRATWVTVNINRIEGHRAKDALEKLKVNVQGDIGEHLRESGRHAIAHAKLDPVINPDDPRDARRLEAERPIIEALAVLAVEDQLGIQTSHTSWREHLYELRGWKSIIPLQIIEASLIPEPPEIQANVDLPRINFRLRRSEPFPMLENMMPVYVGIYKQRVQLVYRSADGLAEIDFWLNFREERLEFDIYQGLKLYDNGTVAAARNGRERCRFIWDYFGNGEIQIWDADNGALLSRVDGYIPTNMYADPDSYAAELAGWDKSIADREQEEAAKR